MRRLLLSFVFVSAMFGSSLSAHPCPEFTTKFNARLTYPSMANGPLDYQGTSRWIYQEFEQNGEPSKNSVSAWKIRVTERRGPGSAWVISVDEAFYTTSEGRTIKVLAGLRPVQIWVPYEQENVVLLDLLYGARLSHIKNEHMSWECSELGPTYRAQQAGTPFYRPIFMKELRDYGKTELRLEQNKGLAPVWRRGTELVLWANSDAGNYDNIIQYHFRDDGEVLALVGSSGWNSDRDDMARTGWTPHVHSVLWRMKPRIGDFRDNDSLYRVRFSQDLLANGNAERFIRDPITSETGFEFDPEEFTSLLAEDPGGGTEAQFYGRKPGYGMRLLTEGVARHRYEPTDPNGPIRTAGNVHDFFVLREKDSEQEAQLIPVYPQSSPAVSSLSSALNAEDVSDGQFVIYAVSSVKHIPRMEDFMYPPRSTYSDPKTDPHFTGVYKPNATRNRTRLKWHGVVLTPRNVHDRIPFGKDEPGTVIDAEEKLPDGPLEFEPG